MTASQRNTSDSTQSMTLTGETPWQNRKRLDLVVTNPSGLLSGAAARFVRTALRFESHILVEKDGEQVDGKSVLGLLTLAAGPGHMLTIHAQGFDASQALDELAPLLQLGSEPA